MSLEIGGRADKYGNEYENQYLTRLFLRIVKGDYKSVIVEPLGENRNSVEYIATDANDFVWHYQCKASNLNRKSWSIDNLNSHKVFNRSKAIINQSEKNKYVFVSPLHYGQLEELCNRARTNSSVEEFLNYQLNNIDIKAAFNDCSKCYELDINDPIQCSELVNILSKSYYEIQPRGIENVLDLNEHVGMLFMGDSNSARCMLENYVNSTSQYGVSITARDIIAFMESGGFNIRNNLYSENITVKLTELNQMFYNSFQPINQTLFHRNETKTIIENIKLGKSIIIHGKAGAGKSGCVQDIINELEKDNILYLALKLDKHIPNISPDNYGKDLGLNQSPVYCLHNLSAKKKCVLILDQLDSLRWTNQHSSTALDICKQMVAQARMLNTCDEGQISIVFITRTFDLENDAGLKSIFSSTGDKNISWAKTQIDILPKDDAKNIVGTRFDSLSHKLQTILQVPSSLYIWTQLNDNIKSEAFATPSELMDKWWQQILERCIASGLTAERTTTFKNTLVSQMDRSSVLSIPIRAFSDYKTEIDALVSNGLLIESDGKISFTHQSFLDHFAISDMLAEIYSGKDILDLIGDLSEQTPTIRYRILRILQSILDADNDYFIKISEDILNSDSVRHYFKCAVFEVLGQSDFPSISLLDYAYSYYNSSEWCDYVYNVVYLGHAAYIMNLDSRSFDWLSDKGLVLLRSINTKFQCFVLDKIKPLTSLDGKEDLKIYNILCHDCSEDGEEMLALRLEIFERNPELLETFWGVSHLIDSDSLNLIPILKLMVKNNDKLKRHIYFGSEEKIKTYAEAHYHDIIRELLPVVCDKTKHFNPRWPNYEYGDEYNSWTRERYNERVCREIVNILKISLAQFAKQTPKQFINFISDFKHQNSVVYYEICSWAIYSLDINYSDFAVSWLYTDPNNHFFIYTGNQDDYLSTTKKIIEKFSHYCSILEFQKLESIILNWKDPVKRMIDIYQCRMDTNRKKNWNSVYYAFWGYLQKELLPFLDNDRTSKKSKDLIEVLNRNSWIRIPHYTCGFSCGPAKNVVSPIDGKTDSISDKRWLEIISTPDGKMSEHFSKKETAKSYIEANHHSFSSSLLVQAKKEPIRFAKLLSLFPKDCYSGYVANVINALYNHDENLPKVDFTIICDVIRRFINTNDINVIKEILRLIGKRSEEMWPQDILQFVCNMAINSKKLTDSIVIKRDEKPSDISPHTLLTYAINSVQGSALESMGDLLWKHAEMSAQFKPIIHQVCLDKNDYIRFSVMFCLLPLFSTDKDFAITTFMELINKDIRTLGFHGAWEIISRDFQNNGDFYSVKFFEACDSNIKELEDDIAGLLCAAAIYYDNTLLDAMFSKKLTEKQVNKVCYQATHSFNQEEYHKISKEVLLHYISIEEYEINAFGRLFFDNCLEIDRDEEFLIKLMNSKQSPHQLHAFLEFVNKQDYDISKYAHVLKHICEGVSSNRDEWDKRMITDDIIKCIIKIFDKNKYNTQVKNICLDMWDDLYRKNLTSIKPFAQIFDNMN